MSERLGGASVPASEKISQFGETFTKTSVSAELFDRHYYSYSRYLKETFGGKTYKVVVSSGLTCPVRDGLLDQGGCAFCDVRGSSSFFGKQGRGKEIAAQIQGSEAIAGAGGYAAFGYITDFQLVDAMKQAPCVPSAITGGTQVGCLPVPNLVIMSAAKTR